MRQYFYLVSFQTGKELSRQSGIKKTSFSLLFVQTVLQILNRPVTCPHWQKSKKGTNETRNSESTHLKNVQNVKKKIFHVHTRSSHSTVNHLGRFYCETSFFSTNIDT